MTAPRGVRAAAAIGLLAGMAGATAALVGAAAGCGTDSHPYVGRHWVEARDCLTNEEFLDTVEGDTLDRTCAPTCVLGQRVLGSDAGREVYVTTVCPPTPLGFDVSGGDPRCAPALAAHGRNDRCLSDGGSTAPAPEEPDAGADATAAP